MLTPDELLEQLDEIVIVKGESPECPLCGEFERDHLGLRKYDTRKWKHNRDKPDKLISGSEGLVMNCRCGHKCRVVVGEEETDDKD